MTSKEIRLAKIAKYLANENDDGRYGRAFELSCARDKSQKKDVSEKNEIDVSVKFVDYKGKAYYVPCEAKTNGGRVDELLEGSKAKYVIYDLHFVQKHKACKTKDAWEEHRDLDCPRLIPVDLFLKKLVEFNAIKAINRNGKLDGYGIQVSSKKWFTWLCDYPVLFDNKTTYEEWKFERLK